MKPKRIAIVGAGLAGLALAWHLSKLLRDSAYHPFEITIYEAKGVGAGASGMAAGLLHPFAGRKAMLSWRAREGMAATLELKAVAEKALGNSVAIASGLLRLPVDAAQHKNFHTCSTDNTDALFTEDEALLIKSAYTFYCESYLEGLWKACHNNGVALRLEKVSSLATLERDYDVVVAAIGADTKALPELTSLSFSYIKGQMLELSYPSKAFTLPCPVMEEVYIIPDEDRRRCIVGATFERQFTTLLPDQHGMDLLPIAYRLYPELQASHVLAHRAAVRVNAPNRRPYYQRVSEKAWVATALGSKGLLYHALLGAELAQSIVETF